MNWEILLAQGLCSFAATAGFGLILDAPRKHLVSCALVGTVNWLIYCAVVWQGGVITLAALFSSMAAALMSHVFARTRKSSVSVFLIPGIIPTVPGGSIYRCVYALSRGEAALSSRYLAETLEIAGAMALGIFITDSLFRIITEKSHAGRRGPAGAAASGRPKN